MLVAAGLAASVSPVNDLDSYWHVQLGREILHRHTLHGLGTDWLAVPARPWLTSQWLSEVGMATAVGHGGWTALIVIRVLLAVALLAAISLTLLPGRPPLLVAPVFAAVVLTLLEIAQDRPQTLSLVLLPLLGYACVRMWERGVRVHPLVVAATCLVWAQLHGMWVLAPASFGLVALGLAVDGPRRNRAAVRQALTALVASLAGLLNPDGLSSLLLPARFRSASTYVAEWGPTTVTDPFTLGWAAVLLLVVLAWARTPRPVPRVELVWVLAWSAFGLLAFRNVAVSLLLVAPAALGALDRAWGEPLRAKYPPAAGRERRWLAVATVGVLAAGAVVGAIRLATVHPLAKTPARQIALKLAAEPRPIRVFNAYNASGSLVAFGGGKVRLVVDGRADLWGADYVAELGAATALETGWQRTLQRLHPEAFVLTQDTPLVAELLRDGGWRVALRDGSYVLLMPTRQPAVTPAVPATPTP